MKCLINAQQRVRLKKNFANMEIKKRNDGVVVSPVNVIINHKCNKKFHYSIRSKYFAVSDWLKSYA